MEYGVLQPPTETGRLDGHRVVPVAPATGDGPCPAVIVLHGAGSRKENHADFARAATGHGFVALTFDNRGHGETEGDLGPARRRRPPRAWPNGSPRRPEVDERRIAARGSSMGGLMAIHAGAATTGVAAVVAICPAAEWMLAEDVRRIADGRAAARRTARWRRCASTPRRWSRWLEEQRRRRGGRADGLEAAAAHPRTRRRGRALHALGGALRARRRSPSELLLLEGGDHRSAQHDAELQGESLRWLARV